MLQIISGRFFGDGQVEAMESDAVLYSNLSWLLPIKTAVAELRPVEGPGRAVTSYVVRYTNRYEKRPDDRVVLAQADEAVDQFRLLASFWFKAFFHPDRHHVELLCRAGPRNSLDDTIPRSFVPGFFEPGRMTTSAEVGGFVEFVGKALAMPRKKYRLVLACLGIFFDALEALGTNFDLAYGMVVYLLEAMCQSEDGYAPAWEDYDQKVRDRLEPVFAGIDAAAAASIRDALLESAHLKLMKRFVGFVVANVTDDLFTTQAQGLTRALPKSRLERALKNLYTSRSGFVHQLKKVREQLRVPWVGPGFDVFDWQNEPYLTFAGLVRLAHHVLSTYISRQPRLEREDYPAWRNELPGTMQVEMAPRYWIWQADGFSPSEARKRLSGLLHHFIDMQTSGNDKSIPDMSAVMERIEEQVDRCSLADRVPLLALYRFYNALVPEHGRRPRLQEVVGRHASLVERCSIEFLAFWPFLLNAPLRWPVEDCVAAFEEYQRRRYSPSAVHLPVLIEVAVTAAIANLYLDAGERDSFALWVDRAILDATGRTPVQEMLAECRASFCVIDTRRLVGLAPAPRQASEADAGRPPGEEAADALPAEPAGPQPASGEPV